MSNAKDANRSIAKQNAGKAESKFISTREAARILRLSVGTVQKMVDRGVLAGWATTGGHRRVSLEAVRHFMTGATRSAAQPGRKSGLSVFVVEDETVQQKLYEAAILGWQMPIALKVIADGFSALIEVGRAHPDVMIVDLNMPGMNGFELIRRIRDDASLSDTEILVVTEMSQEDIVAGGLPDDVLALPKPIPFEFLKGYFCACLAKKQKPIYA